MFVKLTAGLLFTSIVSSAQVTGIRSSTRFDKFTEQKKIQWAAYITDTIHPAAYAFTGTLLNRFQNGEIRIYAPLTREGLMAGEAIQQLNKPELGQRSFAPGMTEPTNRVDSNAAGILQAADILYVENGKLKTYVPWVSAKISIYTSRGLFLGTADYFSTCLNKKYDYRAAHRHAPVFIGFKKRKILIDSIAKKDMLKETYGMTLLEAIWNDITNPRNEFIDLTNGKNTLIKNLPDFGISNGVAVPVYDSLGIIVGYKNVLEPASPLLFKLVELDESWYYYPSKNIIMDTITGITLFRRNPWPGDNNALKPAIKIIFK